MNIIKKILDKYGKESRISLFLIEFCDLDIKKYYPELSAEEFRVIKTKANKSFLYYRISFLCLLYIGLDLVFITNDLGLTKENKMYYLIFFNVLFLLSICSAVKADKKNKEKISQQVQLLAHQEQREAMMKSWESWPEQENGDPVALEKQLRELIDSKHEIIRVQDNLSPEELTVIYLTEKELGEKNGYFPVIVQLSIDLMEFAADRKNEPDNSEQMDATEFQKKAIEEHLKDYEEGDVLGSDDKEGEDLLAAHIGKREEAEGPKINTLNYLQEKGKLVLVRFHVNKPDEIFTQISPDDGDGAPAPYVHRLNARIWNEKYGAVPCFVSYDIVSYYVPKPVDEESSYQLALEHDAYCIDIVGQCDLTVWNHAKSIEQSHFWEFWWD